MPNGAPTGGESVGGVQSSHPTRAGLGTGEGVGVCRSETPGLSPPIPRVCLSGLLELSEALTVPCHHPAWKGMVGGSVHHHHPPPRLAGNGKATSCHLLTLSPVSTWGPPNLMHVTMSPITTTGEHHHHNPPKLSHPSVYPEGQVCGVPGESPPTHPPVGKGEGRGSGSGWTILE